jgi:hypothetical protein
MRDPSGERGRSYLFMLVHSVDEPDSIFTNLGIPYSFIFTTFEKGGFNCASSWYIMLRKALCGIGALLPSLNYFFALVSNSFGVTVAKDFAIKLIGILVYHSDNRGG